MTRRRSQSQSMAGRGTDGVGPRGQRGPALARGRTLAPVGADEGSPGLGPASPGYRRDATVLRGDLGVTRIVKAVVNAESEVRLLEPLRLETSHHALVAILDDRIDAEASSCAVLSEAALSSDWDRPEEDEAWAHLQPAKQSSSRSRSRT